MELILEVNVEYLMKRGLSCHVLQSINTGVCVCVCVCVCACAYMCVRVCVHAQAGACMCMDPRHAYMLV